MRIVYLHQYYKSPKEAGAIRSYHLSRALAEAGHEVFLITTHNQKKSEKTLIYHSEQSSGKVWHYALPIYYHNRLAWSGRLRAFLRFVWASYREAARVPDIDLVLASSTPLSIALPALGLKSLKGWPFVFEVRDLWPEAPIQMGYLQNPWLRFLSRLLEKKAYQHARGIIALSPPIAQSVHKRVPNAQVCVVPNMADCEHAPLVRPKGPILKIAYFGALGPANGLESLIRIAHQAQVQAEDCFQFLIIGEGKEEKKLKDLAQNWQLRNLEFREAQNREELIKSLKDVSVAYVSYAPYPILETGSPNKFFDALALGLACLLNFKGWIWDLVQKSECGMYASPHQAQESLEALQHYLAQPELLQKHRNNARILAETQFARKDLSRNWVRFLEEMQAGSS